jgi:multiple sugar transport system substrate-binding protein
MSKRFLLAGAAALASAGFAASSLGAAPSSAAWPAKPYPTVPSSKQVSITLLSYLPELGASATATLNGFISSFESAHPNIHVTVQALTGSTTNEAGFIQQDEAAGQTPDVVQDAFNDLKFDTSALGALNLDKVVGEPGVAAEFGGKYRYAPAVAKLGEVNGSVYGIPWTLSTPVLFYNASLFKQAGLNPANPPTNWTQVKADALQIKAKTGASGLANGCIGAAASGTDWCLQAILDSAGGSVMNSGQTALTFDAPRDVFALKTMQDLANSGVMVNLSSAQYVQAFAAGKLAMVLNTTALQSTLVGAAGGRFSIYVSKMPGFGTTAAVPTNSGSALFMLSKDKLKREADWELMQYLTSPAVMTAITENIGYPPLRPSLATAPSYLGTWAASNHYLQANLAQLEHITPWLAYPGPNFAAISTILTNAAASVAFQGANPSQVMAQAQSQATGLLK